MQCLIVFDSADSICSALSLSRRPSRQGL